MTAIKQLLNKNIDAYVVDVERDLLFHIITNMRNMEITMARASRLAKEFLDTLPVDDKEIVIKTLSKMGNTYPEAQAIYIKYANDYYARKKDLITKKIHSHLCHGEIKEALKTVKGGIYE